MKIDPGLALSTLLLAACGRSAAPKTGSLDVHCELLALETTTDSETTASFRATNRGDVAFAYQGYADEAPIYSSEVLEEGVWQPSPLGWCGTGLVEQRLEPGESVEFSALVPPDGRSYRFQFGEPPVRTPEVSSVPK